MIIQGYMDKGIHGYKYRDTGIQINVQGYNYKYTGIQIYIK